MFRRCYNQRGSFNDISMEQRIFATEVSVKCYFHNIVGTECNIPNRE